MPATTLVYDPTAPFEDAPPAATSAAPGARLPSLRGAVVGFIDNSKPNFNNLVDELAMALLERCGVKEVVRHRKPVASTPASAAIMADLVNRCDLVITGSGD
jgi:hypothetical protein